MYFKPKQLLLRSTYSEISSAPTEPPQDARYCPDGDLPPNPTEGMFILSWYQISTNHKQFGQSDLYNLCLVSRQWYEVFTPSLYASITLRGSELSLERVTRMLSHINRDHLRYTQEVCIKLPAISYSPGDASTIIHSKFLYDNNFPVV